MKIVVDAFGGDNAPGAVIEGAGLAQKEFGVGIILTGDENIIKEYIDKNGLTFSDLEIIHTTEVFSMHDEPTSLLKTHKNSSMALAFGALVDGKADAFVSAGSTGAVVVGGTLMVKRIKGVKRPALASLIPSPDSSYLLMDIGANAECRPEMLQQFGIMASAYMQKVEGRENPTVGLLNIGTEDTKGGELQKEAYKLLSEAPINFIGNVESREMPKGICDAVVTDGFTGNIALKLIEGTVITLFKMLKGVFYKNIINKLAAGILKKDLYSIKGKMDSSEVGGAILLGVKKPVVKAHGNSDAKAIKNAIKQAKYIYEGKVIESISEGLSALTQED